MLTSKKWFSGGGGWGVFLWFADVWTSSPESQIWHSHVITFMLLPCHPTTQGWYCQLQLSLTAEDYLSWCMRGRMYAPQLWAALNYLCDPPFDVYCVFEQNTGEENKPQRLWSLHWRFTEAQTLALTVVFLLCQRITRPHRTDNLYVRPWLCAM